jgi:hypothetical protein
MPSIFFQATLTFSGKPEANPVKKFLSKLIMFFKDRMFEYANENNVLSLNGLAYKKG